MLTLRHTPGYFAPSVGIPLDLPMSLYLGEVTSPIQAGWPFRVCWHPSAPGNVLWAELAIAVGAPGPGDMAISVVGWVDVTAMLNTAQPDPVHLVIPALVPIGVDPEEDAGLTLVLCGEVAPGGSIPSVVGADATDALGSSRVAIWTFPQSFRPSQAVGVQHSFTASRTARPFKASVLVP